MWRLGTISVSSRRANRHEFSSGGAYVVEILSILESFELGKLITVAGYYVQMDAIKK
ncbi:hypothetical protein [Sedimenticola sp.]|uniref:hypothetical protein n=1 Tax=Sedimenticola sp. TaxID=1940285 RepID=UPI003D0BFAE6